MHRVNRPLVVWCWGLGLGKHSIVPGYVDKTMFTYAYLWHLEVGIMKILEWCPHFLGGARQGTSVIIEKGILPGDSCKKGCYFSWGGSVFEMPRCKSLVGIWYPNRYLSWRNIFKMYAPWEWREREWLLLWNDDSNKERKVQCFALILTENQHS